MGSDQALTLMQALYAFDHAEECCVVWESTSRSLLSYDAGVPTVPCETRIRHMKITSETIVIDRHYAADVEVPRN